MPLLDNSSNKSLAVLCNYKLEPNRVGGMDYFFWEFDSKCREEGYAITWFFPNKATHGYYPIMNINAAQEGESLEDCFLNYINQYSFDLVITHFLELCTPFFKKVKQITSARIIVVDHNPRPIEGYSTIKRIKKLLKGSLYGRYIDLFLGVSQYTSNELIRDFGNGIKGRIQTIYNGIDVDKIKVRQTRNQENPHFIVACHLRESKGVQDLIQAVGLMPDTIKQNLKIDVYGDGPYRAKLEELVKINNLDVVFTFFGSSDKLNEILYQYDYLIHPTHMECFSLGILESLAANVSVITTSVGGNEEAVRNNFNGFIFPARNITALKDIIENVLLGSAAITNDVSIEIRRQFTIQNMVNQHFEIIKCI